MPILHIKALPQKDSSKIEGALKKACLAIADCYGCKPEHVWATWEELRTDWYVEGGLSVEVQPQKTHPPIVTLTCFEGGSSAKVEELLLLTSRALSEELGIDDNIFITYHEAKSGEVAAGNKIIKLH